MADLYLKACPFCGGTPFIDRFKKDSREWVIECTECHVYFFRRGIKESAINNLMERWNTRVDPKKMSPEKNLDFLIPKEK